MNKILFIFLCCVGLTILFALTMLPMPQEVDFYDFHVYECEQAHCENKSFAICSGFWIETNDSHLENRMVVHPCEDCEKHIPHGSCTGQIEYTPIFNIFNLDYYYI